MTCQTLYLFIFENDIKSQVLSEFSYCNVFSNNRSDSFRHVSCQPCMINSDNNSDHHSVEQTRHLWGLLCNKIQHQYAMVPSQNNSIDGYKLLLYFNECGLYTWFYSFIGFFSSQTTKVLHFNVWISVTIF